MRITVAGAGYVGLITGVCLASVGHEVTLLETDRPRLEMLCSGSCPFFEAGIEEMMAAHADRLHYTDKPSEAYGNAEIIFICVGTPERGDGYANLKYVFDAAEQIAGAAEVDCTVVMKSTVPMGTSEKLQKFFGGRARKNVRIELTANPEFLSQGTAVRDFLNGQRLVFGVGSLRGEETLKRVYAGFSQPVIVTNLYTAEMIKYASNNFLALKISYINEIANICELIGADIETVAYGMGLDQRIGVSFLRAGIGYGGSCFPKDTLALHWLAKYHDYEIKTVKAAIEVNENQRLRLLKKARKYYKCLEGLSCAVLGLTFKPGTDDLREAPSIQNIRILLEEGARVNVWDPVGAEKLKSLYPTEVRYCQSIEEAIEDTELCFILTEWDEVKNFALNQYASLMKEPIVIDGRNCYKLSAALEANITYDSIGRESIYRTAQPFAK